jgi:hypothetical protein
MITESLCTVASSGDGCEVIQLGHDLGPQVAHKDGLTGIDTQEQTPWNENQDFRTKFNSISQAPFTITCYRMS